LTSQIQMNLEGKAIWSTFNSSIYETDTRSCCFIFCRSSRAIAKPNFRALDSGNREREDEDWSSEDLDLEAEAGGSKRRRGGKGGARSYLASSKSRQRKTAAVGDLEVAAQEEEAAVAELAPQAEAWKEKYTILVKENEALKKRVEELMKQANQGTTPQPQPQPSLLVAAAQTTTAATAAPPPLAAANTAPLELLNLPVTSQNGVAGRSGLIENQPTEAAPAPEQLPPRLQEEVE